MNLSISSTNNANLSAIKAVGFCINSTAIYFYIVFD